MSSYIIKAIYKPTGEEIEIKAIDDYYGRHEYGYRTPDGTTYNEDGFNLMFTNPTVTPPPPSKGDE